jgi:hypothetical protein
MLFPFKFCYVTCHSCLAKPHLPCIILFLLARSTKLSFVSVKPTLTTADDQTAVQATLYSVSLNNAYGLTAQEVMTLLNVTALEAASSMRVINFGVIPAASTDASSSNNVNVLTYALPIALVCFIVLVAGTVLYQRK